MKGMRWPLGIIAFALALAAAPAGLRADTMDEALAKIEGLEEEGRYAEIIALLEPHAEHANAKLAYTLAYAHLFTVVNGAARGGISGEAMAPAVRWSERAIELGDASGYNLLYLIHENGFGVPEDHDRAVGYLRKGADLGDVSCRMNLAPMLYRGIPPVERDIDRALAMFLELARHDPPDYSSIYYLGVIEFRGQAGMPKDEAGGMEMIAIAANHGITDAERDMGKACEFGWAREEDLACALEWYAKAAEHGDAHSLWRMGMAHVNAELDPADPGKAVEYFRQAADAGSLNGKTSLAVMYASGSGVPQDFHAARLLYEEAMAAGDDHAMRNLAVMYLEGQDVEVDLEKARELATRARDAGDQDAAKVLAAIEQRMLRQRDEH